MPRFACQCIVAVCLCAAFPAVGLTINPGDQNVALSIVPSIELSAPTGTVVAQNIQPLNISTANDGAFGSLESQVVKDPTTGDLTFVYTFLASAAPPGNAGVLPYYVSNVSASGFSRFTTDVSASDQSPGASSSSDFGQEVTGFVKRSSDGKTVTLDVPQSTNSPFFFDTMQIATDAKSFDNFGIAVVTADESEVTPDSQTFTTFEPAVSAPPVLEVAPLAILILIAWQWKNPCRGRLL
jgi:hypothetical protein